ncbi:hypothetical protein N0V93_002962 [Gnomoniopsis smithogilvyi]|uniref:O-methyltransferase n=1 Tax=Gnomoniopsis smithogilvyi TaxID=1191159 RepID=A0A9W9CZF8_9PEZI|nr:hypothetical protein N0V93_002962 [Gnomoniopsis smithogilvyi]
MSDISRATDVLNSLADAPPTDAAERQRIYAAAKKLMAVVEDPFDTIHRVNFSPLILTSVYLANNLGVLDALSKAEGPLSGAALAESAKADPVLLSRILRFLASNDLIAETGEDEFTASAVTKTLARPGFQAGAMHAFEVGAPCFLATPQFLKDTKYKNPDNVVHSPFQVAMSTDKPAFVWAGEHPELLSQFNLWMSELHDGQKNFLDVFDLPAYVNKGAVATGDGNVPMFVDIGGGIGQQCALLKQVHPNLAGRVILQEQPFLLPHAIPVPGMESEAFDFWNPQPHKGALVYYMRNILHDYPDEKALTLLANTIPALSKDSVLVIDEMIIPNKRAHPRATGQDLMMMASLASMERTERQWDSLLERAGLKVLEKKTYNSETGQSVLVVVPM